MALRALSFPVALIVALSLTTQAFALEKCWYERHRAVYPPGKPEVKVHFGKGKQDVRVEKFFEAKKMFEFLKQADGKRCEVDWAGAKKEMEDWLASQSFVEESFGSEINALIARQNQTPTPEAKPGEPVGAPSKLAAGSSCESKLAEVRSLVSALGSSIYNSREKRSTAVADILKVIDEPAQKTSR